MNKIYIILLLAPFISLGQSENQLLTSIKGIYIEQNEFGKYGITNDKGDTLVAIVNDHIEEVSFGQGFFVYEKVIVDGPDYKSGTIRFYDKNIIDVFDRTFTRISDTDKDFLICYDNHLCGVLAKDGRTIAPICFIEITFLGDNLFWFSTENYLRETMVNILNSQTINKENIPENVQRWGDDYQLFQGVFNTKGNLICKGEFRLVFILINNGENSLLSVQSQKQFIDNDGNANSAIMNGKGKLVSEYIYWDVLKIDGQLIGEIDTGQAPKSVVLNKKGIPQE